MLCTSKEQIDENNARVLNTSVGMNIKKHGFKIIAAVCLMLGGCSGGGESERYHNSELTHANMKWHLEKNRTTQGEVMEAFGPPNVTSVDSEGLEMWVYQKMSTSTIEKAFGGGLNLSALINEVSGNVMGGMAQAGIKGNLGGSGGFRGGRHTSTQSSKTCALILKFDAAGVLVEYRFRTSNF